MNADTLPAASKRRPSTTPSAAAPALRVAAIDIGSNSIHMIVVEAHPGRDLRILDREKEMVRLGDSAFSDGRLSASAQARALSTIARFLDLAKRRGA